MVYGHHKDLWDSQPLEWSELRNFYFIQKPEGIFLLELLHIRRRIWGRKWFSLPTYTPSRSDVLANTFDYCIWFLLKEPIFWLGERTWKTHNVNWTCSNTTVRVLLLCGIPVKQVLWDAWTKDFMQIAQGGKVIIRMLRPRPAGSLSEKLWRQGQQCHRVGLRKAGHHVADGPCQPNGSPWPATRPAAGPTLGLGRCPRPSSQAPGRLPPKRNPQPWLVYSQPLSEGPVHFRSPPEDWLTSLW